MAIDRSDIEKIAKLARLNINEEEISEVTESISNILSLVDKMQSADTTGIAPMAHPMDAVQRLRPDIVIEKNEREKFQKIAPAAEAGLYLVPKVIE
jgi:aspartyl-tRNA(Asn)/glutamyl-tRNA(Gln) amidotransferase subunit C